MLYPLLRVQKILFFMLLLKLVFGLYFGLSFHFERLLKSKTKFSKEVLNFFFF